MENLKKIFQNVRIKLFGTNLSEYILNSPGVYLLGNLDMTCFYVGSSGNLRERLYQHRSMLQNNKHENKNLQDLYNKINGAIWFIAINLKTLEESREIEQFILDNPPDFSKICNIAIDVNCSPKGISPSLETKEKISKSSTGHKKSEETKLKMKQFWSDPIQREKIRQQNLGTKHTKEMSEKKSISLSKPVEINGKIFPSSKAASKELGISIGNVSTKLSNPKYPNWRRL